MHLKAEEAFETSLSCDLLVGPRNAALELAYGTIRKRASAGHLSADIHLGPNGTVNSQVMAILRRDGYVVNPGFSSGDLIVSWG